MMTESVCDDLNGKGVTLLHGRSILAEAGDVWFYGGVIGTRTD
jgi:hypothetical protein